MHTLMRSPFWRWNEAKGKNRNDLIDAIRTRNKDDAEDMEKAIKDIEESAINEKNN